MEHFDVLIVGAGLSGIGAGAHLYALEQWREGKIGLGNVSAAYDPDPQFSCHF